MVMIARPAHASQTVDTSGTHLSCVMSPHSASLKQVCMQVSNTPPSVAKEPIQIAQAQINNPIHVECLLLVQPDTQTRIILVPS